MLERHEAKHKRRPRVNRSQRIVPGSRRDQAFFTAAHDTDRRANSVPIAVARENQVFLVVGSPQAVVGRRGMSAMMIVVPPSGMPETMISKMLRQQALSEIWPPAHCGGYEHALPKPTEQ